MGRLSFFFLKGYGEVKLVLPFQFPLMKRLGSSLLYCHTPTYNDRLTVQDECVGW